MQTSKWKKEVSIQSEKQTARQCCTSKPIDHSKRNYVSSSKDCLIDLRSRCAQRRSPFPPLPPPQHVPHSFPVSCRSAATTARTSPPLRPARQKNTPQRRDCAPSPATRHREISHREPLKSGMKFCYGFAQCGRQPFQCANWPLQGTSYNGKVS